MSKTRCTTYFGRRDIPQSSLDVVIVIPAKQTIELYRQFPSSNTSTGSISRTSELASFTKVHLSLKVDFVSCCIKMCNGIELNRSEEPFGNADSMHWSPIFHKTDIVCSCLIYNFGYQLLKLILVI
jgi:hypothetical protein